MSFIRWMKDKIALIEQGNVLHHYFNGFSFENVNEINAAVILMDSGFLHYRNLFKVKTRQISFS
jgi:hypothetical protein